MSGGADERVEALADRLRAVEEELGDVILDVLRDAVSKGEAKRPELERRLTRARNAVTKAVHLLDGGPAGDGEEA